eukprot:Nitzschia sp. Nitz4//scaffold120_size68122//11065//14928//NITZ4_006037-RA/size68122-processed-gene-0.32-mRNA-1//1//CDS//3329534257//6764//frame0
MTSDASPSTTLSVVPNAANAANAGLIAQTTLNPSSSSSSPSGHPTAPNASNQNNNHADPHSAYPSSMEALDFIGTAPAVKSLFSIPFAERPVCVAVHNWNGTLLVDDVSPFLEDTQQQQQHHHHQQQQQAATTSQDTPPPFTQRTSPALQTQLEHDQPPQQALQLVSHFLQSPPSATDDAMQTSSTSTTSLSPVREYVPWNFAGSQWLVGSDALVVRPTPPDPAQPGVVVRMEELHQLQTQLHQLELEAEKATESITTEGIPRSYAHALLSAASTDKEEAAPGAATSGPLHNNNNNNNNNNNMLPTSATSSSMLPLNFDQVQLQTYMAAASPPVAATSDPAATPNTSTGTPLLSPKCVVLDAYLDNLMTNIPQLALCLQEKGLIQSVKWMHRDQIPGMMMHPSTLDTTHPVETVASSASQPDLFSPEIMEMNATALLRFLKAHCTSNNTTYLLRSQHPGMQQPVQLYDISAISQQRQKKWIWWLATMSYRFALRLRQLETHHHPVVQPQQQRAIRDRQRSLLQSTLDLLQDLRDMDGNAHESMVASVREHLADTFLGDQATTTNAASEETKDATSPSNSPALGPKRLSSTPPTSGNGLPAAVTLSPTKLAPPVATHSGASKSNKAKSTTIHQPYAAISNDALNKAQDHLASGIKALTPVLEAQLAEMTSSATNPRTGRRRPRDAQSTHTDTEGSSAPSSATVSQLFGMKFKLVNVSLRLAEQYMEQYSGSNAMRSLREAARRMAESISLLEYHSNPQRWIPRLQLQYTWLWEHCGHFARSFASDDLWRERGHAAGDDVLYVLRDVERAFVQTELPFHFSRTPDPLRSKTKGQVSLNSLSAVVSTNDASTPELKGEAREWLSSQGQLQRDKRQVLVASCISYGRAIAVFQELTAQTAPDSGLEFEDVVTMATQPQERLRILNVLRQRLGDACNETGKVLLDSLRALLTKPNVTPTPGLPDVLLDSAQFWFSQGLVAFQLCSDLRNIALLRCNLCQCDKLRANATFVSQATQEAPHAEVCLERAISQLQAAHSEMGEREVDPMTWDMVSEELAATFLVLAVRRRQSLLGGGTTPVMFEALRLSPGKERSIIEPMEKALKIYQQAGNLHQAAAVHYQLALTNSKIWTCQRDEAKTREKLTASFQQYNEAFNFFSNHLRGNEPTFVLLSLDIASLYAAVSGEDCLVQALDRCLDTAPAFSPDSIEATGYAKPWMEKMCTLASSMEERVFRLLRSLVKLDGDGWKDLYRVALEAKIKRAIPATEKGAARQVLEVLLVNHILVTLRSQWKVST